MVGVAGKYKGCETCRRRRVTCNNERPHCSNCLNSGRRCEGYEKQRVFITGTPEHKGRVASHPKKANTSSGTSSRSRSRVKGEPSPNPEATPERDIRVEGRARRRRHYQTVVPCKPLTPAWDDYIALEADGVRLWALVTAFQQPIQYIDTREPIYEREEEFTVALAPYSPIEMSPFSSDDTKTSARCLVHLSSSNERQQPTENYCVWLHEKDEPATSLDFEPPYKFDTVRTMGADFFADFPHHQFFVRVHRPFAVGIAVMRRQHTFLADQEWITAPWRNHPKSLFDQLLDFVASLPYLLERTDEIVPLQGTMARRDEAHNLLQNGLALESQFERWLETACQATREHTVPYWAAEAKDPGGFPFYHSYVFKDSVTGSMFLHYWMSQIPLHRCIETLYNIIYEPVLDLHPDMWSNLPSDLRIEDLPKYQQTQELAANICRGLDSALEGTVQPDILVAPMNMALNLYRDMNAVMQDYTLEILWLETFRDRLMEKGRSLTSMLQEQTWLEVGRM